MARSHVRAIAERRAKVMPLADFDDERRELIEFLVEQDSPPPRWLNFGLCQMESRAWYEWHWARGIEPGLRREPISKALRAQVIERDGLICQLCLEPVEPADIHLDHIKPWSKGGQTTLGNLQVTHSICNLRKGAKH